MRHYEFNGTWRECLDKLDEYFCLRDLSLRARVVIDIEHIRADLEAENTEFEYGHNVKHFSED